MKRILLFLLGILIHQASYAQGHFNNINFAYLYQTDGEILANAIAYSNGNSVDVTLNLQLNRDEAVASYYSVQFYTASDYKSKSEKLTAIKTDSSTFLSDKTIIKRYTLPQCKKILLAEIKSKLTAVNYYIPVDVVPAQFQLSTSAGAPSLINSWLRPTSITADTSLHVFLYTDNFPPALPAMPSDFALPPQEINIDSSFTLPPKQRISLTKQGLYLFQRDTSSSEAYSFRIQNKNYPKFTTLNDLIEPLRYITTGEEYDQLIAVNGDKSKFDQFWIELTNSPERAKYIIKSYYDRVERANSLFTTYKEGWKTDMGMIYIIFGTPNEVIKENNGETWNYEATNQLPKLKFTFASSQNIFSRNSTYLIREKRYTAAWYRAIDLWRKGRF